MAIKQNYNSLIRDGLSSTLGGQFDRCHAIPRRNVPHFVHLFLKFGITQWIIFENRRKLNKSVTLLSDLFISESFTETEMHAHDLQYQF